MPGRFDLESKAMAKIFMVPIDSGPGYRVVLFQPGTFINTRLNDPDRLAIAVYATPGANMSKPSVSRVLVNPDPTDDYEMESFLPCNAKTTLALFATGFEWDEAARKVADQFAVSPDDTRALQEEILR